MSDAKVIDYLKANKLYDTFASAAGVAKDATVTDVHVPAAIAKPPAVEEKPKPKVDELDGDGELKKFVELRKADALFAKEAQPNLYVHRPLTQGSAERLHAWVTEKGIPNLVPPELMHVTQVHTEDPVDLDKFKPQSTLLDVPADGRHLSQLGKGNALVMFLSSPEMQQRHEEAQAAGAKWDFPSFLPHVTLSYDTGDVPAQDYAMRRAPDVPVQLGPEVFAASNDNWTKENNLAKADWEMKVKITKVNPDRQIIGGWAFISSIGGVEVIDKQGDMIAVDDLEKAFHEYVMYSRDHGDMHEKRGTGKLIGALTFTPEKAALGLVAKNEKGEQLYGTWVEYQISDAGTWASIKNGDLPELSIGGNASPVPA